MRPTVKPLVGQGFRRVRIVPIPNPITGPAKAALDYLPSRLLRLLQADDGLLGVYASWWARTKGASGAAGNPSMTWINPGLWARCRFRRQRVRGRRGGTRRGRMRGDGSPRHRAGRLAAITTRFDGHRTRSLTVARARALAKTQSWLRGRSLMNETNR
jgi:hypothetical protein